MGIPMQKYFQFKSKIYLTKSKIFLSQILYLMRMGLVNLQHCQRLIKNLSTHTFELTEGDGDDDNNQFNITGNILSSTNLNFETKNKLKIRVKAVSSNGGYSYEKSFTIFVNDQPDNILDISLDNNSILENKSIGSLVGKILITDEYEVCENCQPKLPGYALFSRNWR